MEIPRRTLVLAVALLGFGAAGACATFSSDDGSLPPSTPEAGGGVGGDGASSVVDAAGPGADAGDGAAGEPSKDAGCPALPTSANSLLCAGAPCAAPGSICCSNPAAGPSMVCTPGGAGCAVAATYRTRACGSRTHCQAGQGHCCASALVITASAQCPLVAQGADVEGPGSACEVAACAPSPELCAAGESCGGGYTCLPVSIVLDGLPTIIGVCRSL